MPEFRCLNKHSHPEDTKGCLEGCMMCCGYCTPSVIGLLVAALAIVSDVYSILLIARNPHSAWRIVVCLIVFVLTTALAAAVCWSYWAIVFTSPGYVPEDPWRHPPRYCGPPLPPRDGDRANSGPGMQHASPSMVRRSPTASGEHAHRPQSNSVTPTPPQQQAQWPAASPTPPEQPSALNPLSDSAEQKGVGGHDEAAAAAGAQQHHQQHQQEEENKTGEVAAGALYSDSGESGKGQRVALALSAERSDTSINDKVNDENCAPGDVEVPLRRQPSLPGGARGDVPAGAAPPASHSPFATPMYPHSTVAAAAPAAHGAPPPFASPNPYTVTSLTSNGALRFCSICRLYKPDGAHHCRMCGKCVFNFDHHCPFVNNCVGRNNYKLFVLFLLYSGVGATLAGGLMAITLFAVDTGEIMSKIGWIAVPALDVILGLSLLLFYAQHQMLLCKGQSTLESIIQSDNTFAGWRRSHSRPRPTAAEKAEAERKKKVKVERHYRTLFGNESPWWRRYLPLPVRTDVRADDTVAGNV